MGPSVPKGPSAQQIKTESQLEEERVKFENEKRLFIERVGSYESIARDRLSGERTSFESADFVPMDASGIYIPQKFDPSFDPSKFAGQDFSWFNAPNLGIANQWAPTIPVINPQAGLPNQLNQTNRTRQNRREWIDQWRGAQ
jgi:hypothetical protein